MFNQRGFSVRIPVMTKLLREAAFCPPSEPQLLPTVRYLFPPRPWTLEGSSVWARKPNVETRIHAFTALASWRQSRKAADTPSVSRFLSARQSIIPAPSSLTPTQSWSLWAPTSHTHRDTSPHIQRLNIRVKKAEHPC